MPNIKSVISVVLVGLIASYSAFTAPKNRKKTKPDSEIQQPAPSKAASKTVSVTVHDCCPQETSALAVQIELKATAEGIYTGTERITVSEKDYSALTQYAAACSRIAKALSRSRRTEVCATFNTKSDRTGTELRFSTESDFKEAVRILSELEEKDVFAFYEKPSVPEPEPAVQEDSNE